MFAREGLLLLLSEKRCKFFKAFAKNLQQASNLCKLHDSPGQLPHISYKRHFLGKGAFALSDRLEVSLE